MELIAALSPAWMPKWAVSLAILALAALAGLALHEVAARVVRRVLRNRDDFWRALVQRTRRPTRMAAAILAVAMAVPLAPLSAPQTDLIGRILLVGVILLVGWAALTALDIAALLHTRRYKLDVEDNLLARKHVTQTRILHRTLATLIVILTLAFALMTFKEVRQYGVSLLASAGAAGIIAGLALQPLLTNLIAGVQIAMTQPIRIDDAVIVEGEWGWIEEINSTYVVVRLWDWRRMILPLTYFIQKPFQNWTREGASLIGTAFIYVDYKAPVDVLRRKLEEIARASALWDGRVVNLAVTDLTERSMQVRCLVSARNAATTFDLRCEVREKMLAFLQVEMPQVLPQDRIELDAQTAA